MCAQNFKTLCSQCCCHREVWLQLHALHYGKIFGNFSWNASVCMVLLMAITEHLQAEVSVGEVMSCPNTLGTLNADGSDGIPPQLIKECSTKSLQVCAWSSTNHSLQVKFLGNWNLQTYNVTSIHRKNAKEAAGNFQSILLPPIVSKVLERLVFDHPLIIRRK